jgi:cytochrome c-type biogenesis protein
MDSFILPIFTALSHALENGPALALLSAFAWGILSILFSPCHLASIPLIIAFIDEQGRVSTKRAFFVSLLFASGILVTIAAIGGISAAAGRIMGDVGPYGTYILAGVFLLIGLHFWGLLPMPWSSGSRPSILKKGPLAAFLLGLILGIGLGPCTFAFMAPMLGVIFKVATTQMIYASLLLLAFGLGHCTVIVFAGTFTEVVQRYLDWNERSGGAVVVKKVCGILLMIAAGYLIYGVIA